jgi:hypothetical protein
MMSLIAAFFLAISIFLVCVIYVIFRRSSNFLDDDIEEDGGQRTRIRHEGGI